jgi:hypothetical protein
MNLKPPELALPNTHYRLNSFSLKIISLGEQ